MATSFVTRFRRHLATVPFVIVFLIPVGIAAVYIVKQSEARENVIAPVEMEQGVRAICLNAEPFARELKACPNEVQGAE